MAEDIRNVRETTTRTGDTVQKNTEVIDQRSDAEHQQNVATRVIWFIASVLITLLLFRFVFSLLGANTENVLASFVYTVSQPFVAPFFSLFGYDNYTYGVARFEVYTLIAIAFYTLIAWGIARLVTLNRD